MRGKAGAFPGERPCAEPGCPEGGEYRAPVVRPGSALLPPSGPPEWQYFCLAHVREFNARWNYFEGMDADAIWAAQSPHAGWADHSTQPFARNAAAGAVDLDDPFGLFGQKTMRPQPALSAENRRALATLGLDEEATLAEVKAQYRKLARRYHPDANQGDRRHEERFRTLTEAYARLCGANGLNGHGAARHS